MIGWSSFQHRSSNTWNFLENTLQKLFKSNIRMGALYPLSYIQQERLELS